MPMYDYICSKCEHEFERLLTLSKRLEPESEPCEKCGEKNIKQTLKWAASVGDPVRMGMKKPGGDFKEVMHKINDNNPLNTIGEKLDRH